MPTPATFQTETYRPDIAQAMMQFDLQADQMGFVGLRIAPALEVAEVGGQYGVIKIEEMLKKRSTDRSPDGSYNRGQGKGSKDTYMCEEHGFEERVDDREAQMYRNWWDAEMLAAERTRDAVLRNHEERVVDLALSTTADAGNETGVTNGAWTVPGTATPIDDVKAAKIAIRDRTGLTRHRLCVEWEIWLNLQQNAQIIDKLKFWGGNEPNTDAMTQALVARALGVDELIVAGSLENSAPEGVTGTPATLAPLWDKTKALLFVSNDSPNLRAPRYMNTFHWGADGSSIGSTFETYRDPTRRSDIVRNRMDTDEKVTYAACAEAITGVSA